MRACWLKWVGRDWSISADYIWLNYSGANTDGQIHLENQVGCQRFDLTTGEAKTVVPTAKNMSTVFGKDGVETEIQVGQMRQLGKPGFGWLFNKR